MNDTERRLEGFLSAVEDLVRFYRIDRVELEVKTSFEDVEVTYRCFQNSTREPTVS